jgi:hypothetical protein
MSSSRFFDGRTATGFIRSFCQGKFRPTISNRELGTANTNNHASPKSDPPGFDAARGSGGGCVGGFNASAERHAEENRLFQSWERVASTEIIERRSGRRERGQKAPTADRISEIQQALAKDGSFTGKPNGKWDDSTIEATRKFQEAHGLNATGKLDAKTLQQLGLGSQTAGVAAPMPSVNSSSLRKQAPSPAVPQHH